MVIVSDFKFGSCPGCHVRQCFNLWHSKGLLEVLAD
jgi:hypothetical protein